MSLRPLLEAEKFVVTAEVGPLKGTDTTELEEATELLRGRVDAANVTDQQSSVMRLGRNSFKPRLSIMLMPSLNL